MSLERERHEREDQMPILSFLSYDVSRDQKKRTKRVNQEFFKKKE